MTSLLANIDPAFKTLAPRAADWLSILPEIAVAGLALLCLLQALVLPPAQRWLQPATARVGLLLVIVMSLTDGTPWNLPHGAENFPASFFTGADGLPAFHGLLLGVIGSGYVAAVMPADITAQYLGPESGFLGVGIAILAGAFTPGGPVVGFSIGAAAIKSGAGAPQVIAYVTAWALFAVQRFILWELPIMPRRLVWIRTVASLPLPLIVAGAAMLLGKP